MQIKFEVDKNFFKMYAKELENELGSIEIGYFDDTAIYKPLAGSLTKQGKITLRKKSKEVSKNTLLKIVEKNELKYRFLTAPLEDTNTEEFKELITATIGLQVYKDNTFKQRIVNNAKAFILKPILREKYGNNSPKTQKMKGFNKLMVDTGQMINNLKVRIKDEVL
jgi:hypothetical protein